MVPKLLELFYQEEFRIEKVITRKGKKLLQNLIRTTSEFNNLAAKCFPARLAKANLATKTDLDTKLIPQ